MKSAIISALVALVFRQAAAHATFQDLWVNGVDKISVLQAFFYSSTDSVDLPGNLCPNTAIKFTHHLRSHQ